MRHALAVTAIDTPLLCEPLDLGVVPPAGPRDLRAALGEAQTELNVEQHERRVAYAIALGLPSAAHLADQFIGQRAVVVGSGPSYDARYVARAKAAGAKIFAVNCQHDRLIKDGITPDFGVLFDPAERVGGYMKPDPYIRYIIGSSVHPVVWALFREAGIFPYVFIPTVGDNQHERLEARYPGSDWSFVTGCTTVGLRTINIAMMMGFHTEIHAMDSCYAPGHDGLLKTGLYCVDKPATTHDTRSITVRSGRTGDRFTCFTNGNMARQVLGFDSIIRGLPETIPNRPMERGMSDEEAMARVGRHRLKVSGDGIIPWMAWKDGGPDMWVEHTEPERMRAKYGDAKHWDYYNDKPMVEHA